jgi:very-short-patch-repair endonuclease
MATQAPTGVTAGEVHVEPLDGAKRRPHWLDGNRDHADRVLAELADAQHGIVARYQLLGAGIGRRAIGGRLERGALHPIHRGVYSVGHSVVTACGRWMAATLALGPDAVLSHQSAAELWGIAPRLGRAIEVTRATKSRRRPRITSHRSALPDNERTAAEGIPVTTAPRTILDLAAIASRRQVERALNEVEVQGLTDRLSIPDLLERYPGRRGSAVLRALLRDATPMAGSTKNDFEELFVSLLDSHGLPRPRFNVDLAVAGRFFSVDCLWPQERLIVELDGRAVHGTRQAFEADRERDRILQAAGWKIIRVTWRQLRDQGAAVTADLSRALAQG